MQDELEQRLSATAWRVTQEKGTEQPYSGKYNQFDESGNYYCICCHSHLFSSEHKFESSCGWPAFYQALENTTDEITDLSHGMNRIEIVCNNCKAHLGHKFPDGPYGTRYCINSAALEFKPG